MANTFEYTSVEKPHNELTEHINTLAKEGWRLVAITALGNSWNVLAILEKQK